MRYTLSLMQAQKFIYQMFKWFIKPHVGFKILLSPYGSDQGRQRDTETFPQHRPYGDHYRQLAI